MRPIRTKNILPLVLPLLAAAALFAASEEGSAPPLAPARPVVDRYWGVDVIDDYRYMESLDDPEVVEWMKGQDDHARRRLDAFPGREALAERVKDLMRAETSSYYGIVLRGGVTFAIKRQPPKQQAFLVVLGSLDKKDDERILVDPNVLDPEGGVSIDFFVPSPSGRCVAVSLSEHGTEDGTLFVYRVGTGEPLPDEIPRVNGGTAGGSAAWTASEEAIYYTRYPYPGERPKEDLPFYQQIWLHRLGTDVSEDDYVLGESFPRIAEIAFVSSGDGTGILARVSNGDGGEHEFWLLREDGSWTRFARFEDGIEEARF
ncbi:MAG: S9 family peptidase, partial [Candidatus Eisenbacteria bacterium]